MTSRDTTRVMKRFTADALPAHVAFNFGDVQQRLDDYKRQVKEECRQEILQATEDAERLRVDAQSEGFAQGLAEGRAQAAAEFEQQVRAVAQQLMDERLATVLPTMSTLLNELANEHVQRQADFEREVIDLSLAIAEKLIQHELATRPERLSGIISQAMQLVVGTSKIGVMLNPIDHAVLGDRLRPILQEVSHGLEVQLLSADSVPRGGCVVSTEHGQIDARLQTMLERIRSELLET